MHWGFLTNSPWCALICFGQLYFGHRSIFELWWGRIKIARHLLIELLIPNNRLKLDLAQPLGVPHQFAMILAQHLVPKIALWSRILQWWPWWPWWWPRYDHNDDHKDDHDGENVIDAFWPNWPNDYFVMMTMIPISLSFTLIIPTPRFVAINFWLHNN